MRQAPVHLQALLQPVIEAMGYELVGIEYRSGSRSALLRLYVDREGGITVDDCARVSHQVSGVLDVEDPVHGQYTLEVSSPGLDRPLFNLEQFRPYIGSSVRLLLREALQGRRRFKGTIKAVQENSVVLITEEGEEVIAESLIDKANLVPDFQQPAGKV